MKENIIVDKSFAFSIRVVKPYQYLTNKKKSMYCLNSFCDAGHQLVQILMKHKLPKAKKFYN